MGHGLQAGKVHASGVLKLAFVALCALPLFAQPATTTVADQLYMAIGGPTYCTGTLTLSWSDFYSEDGFLIKAGSLSRPVNSTGQFSVNVVPTNLNTTPASGIYRIQYNLQPAGCAATSEAWSVPTGGGPVDLNMVRTLPTPPPSLIPITSLYPSLLSGTYTLCSINFIIQWGSCGGGTQVYPGAGIPNSTGSAWSTSYNATTLTAFLNLFSSSLQGLTPASGGGTTNFLRADGSWAAPSGSFSYPGAGVVCSTGSAWCTSYTATTLTAFLNPFSSSLQGVVPASGGGTTNFLRADGSWAAPSGSGTVTSFSAGNLSPLFTTSVATSTSTPALTFSLTNAAGTSWYGNAAGTSGAPSYNTTALPNALIPTPTLSALGGAEAINAASHKWLASLATTGIFTETQPAFSDLSGSNTCSQLPALTGDATSSAGSCATTVVQVNGAAVPASANPVSTNSSRQFVASTVQGNGTKVQLSTGTTTTNDCVKYDANGNTVDSGSACASGGPTTNQNIRSVSAVFDGGGSALSGTVTRCSQVNYAGTINEATIIADVSGSATIDVRTVAYSSYTGPSSASTITASATPALSSAVKYQDSTLSGWTTSLSANTVVCFVLTSPSTVTWLAANIKVTAN